MQHSGGRTVTNTLHPLPIEAVQEVKVLHIVSHETSRQEITNEELRNGCIGVQNVYISSLS